MSAYDKMDLFSPDIVFAHYMFLTGDIIRYLSNSQIQIVINVTGIQQHELDTIVKEIKDKNVNCPFMFSNLPREAIKVKTNDIKIHSIMSAADVFLTSTDYFDISKFQQLLDKLEASKGRQKRQEALEDRRGQFAAGIANVMSNF